MLKEIKKLVKKACFAKTNFFGPSCWDHIKEVVHFSRQLATKMSTSSEICEIAAWLHDYAAVFKRKWYPEHHIHGARLAEKVLQELNYPQEKIRKVKHCIFAHRGSRNIPRKTLEAKIVASADSMSHFIELHRLFWLAYGRYEMNVEEGKKWVLAKLERTFIRFSMNTKEIVKERYQAMKMLLKV